MGMVCTLVRVKESDVSSLIDSPEKVQKLLVDENLERDYPIETVRLPGCAGLIMRFLPITISQVAERPEGSPLPLPPDPNRFELEVWDDLNFLFTGTATEGSFPAAFLVLGGDTLEEASDELDNEVRLIRGADVRAVSDFLESLSEADLRARFDIPQMAKFRLLDKRTTEADSRPLLDGLIAECQGLKEFVAETAARRDALLVTVS